MDNPFSTAIEDYIRNNITLDYFIKTKSDIAPNTVLDKIKSTGANTKRPGKLKSAKPLKPEDIKKFELPKLKKLPKKGPEDKKKEFEWPKLKKNQ